MAVELDALNVVCGANGSGKSSFYRAMRLIADIAHGHVIRSLAFEGGLKSTLWAGPEAISREVKRGVFPVEGTLRKGPISLKLGFCSDSLGYAIDLGLPISDSRSSKFFADPVVKLEAMWSGGALGRSNEIARRAGPLVRIRDSAGAWRDVATAMAPYDSMLSHCSDPRQSPELLDLREWMRNWRFYDQLRTDAAAPARQRQIGTRTTALADDGADLAAAIQTIFETGARDELEASIADAFAGGEVDVIESEGYFEVVMRQSGLLRPLHAAELSDGTLRYLLLVAALLSPRPPHLMTLNEPETSLHPDLIAPLARLVARAAKRTQMIVVTHSAPLVRALAETPRARRIELDKQLGETMIQDRTRPAWAWPRR